MAKKYIWIFFKSVFARTLRKAVSKQGDYFIISLFLSKEENTLTN